ncbi:MAG TPA: hypothetical protein VIJ92_17450 [Ginsengibacter sp.]
MKPLLLFFSIIIFTLIISCNSGDKEKNESPEVVTADTVYDYTDSSDADSLLHVKNESLLWHVDDSNGLRIRKPLIGGIDTMSVQNIIQLINSNYDSIHVDFVKISHDTIYVHIPDSKMLTERIGSTGAEMFMASATYSLTELKGIRFVDYDFIEGEHAMPGVYDRSYFKNLE